MTRVSAPALGDPEDLSVRARQGSLSEAERLLWERALAADPTLSVAHQIGVDFDRVGLVQSGDDQLVARMADRTLDGERPRRRLASVRRRLVFVLAAALTVAGTATALHGGVLRPSAPASLSDAARAAQPPSGARAKPVVPAKPLLEPTRAAELPPVASSPVALSLVGVASDSGRALASLPNALDDAAALFREAAAARRSSDFGRARLLYLRLESTFPGSPEAHLAPVSLGKVLLLMGRAGEAEQQFAQYSSAGGTLAEEALVGQAQSLARLGRASDEQSVWQRLLRDFPHSLYAVEATQRLSALAAADPR